MSSSSPLVLPEANSKIAMPHFELGERLSLEQSQYLDNYGFIRFRRFASRDAVADLNAEIDGLSERFISEGRVSINGIPLLIGKRKDGGRFVQRLVFASLFSEKLHAFLKDPRYKGILEVAGPGYRIAENERDGLVINTNRKEQGSKYTQLAWHTDSLRDVFYLEKPRRYLNVGFYLTDSSIEQGGLRLLPFTHRQSVWAMLTRKPHFLDTRPDADEYAVEADAGDLTIHDGRIWHRVAPSAVEGEGSQRRVMYIPLMEGPLKPKSEGSRTPLYFRLKRFAKM
jgi:ectoine hydroxylase-related dioxygenase (phytanoyl-CoA dioxygenase family)